MVGSAWSTSFEDATTSESGWSTPGARRRQPANNPLGDLSFAGGLDPSAPASAPASPSVDPIQLSYDPSRVDRAQTQQAPSAPASPAAPSASSAPSAFQSTTQFKTTLDELSRATDPQQQAVLKDKLSRDLATSLQAAGHKVSFKGDQLIVDGRPYVVGPANGNTGVAGPNTGTSIDQAQGAPSVGHNGVTASGLNREAYRDTWMGSGAASMADLERYVAQHGGQILSGNGTVRTPFGEEIEMLIGARGAADGKGPARPGWGAPGGGGSAGGGGLAGGASARAGITGSLEGLSGSDMGLSWADFDRDLDQLGGRLPLGSMGPGYTPDALEDGALETETDGLIRDLLKNPESLDPHTLEILKAMSREELADLAASDDEAMRAMGTSMGIEDSNWLASERLARRDSRNSAIVSGNRALDVEAATRRGEEKRSAASLGLSASAQKTQKAALRESFKQKAAELGVTEAQVRLDHTRTLLSAVGAKYGIDVGAGLDLKKLALMDEQFQDELAYKLQALAQADEQFGAGLGLSYAQLNTERDQQAFDNWFKTTFAGE